MAYLLSKSNILSGFRSHLQEDPAKTLRRGYHIELGAREKALLEEDAALKRFKSYKKAVKQASKIGSALTILTVAGGKVARLVEEVSLDDEKEQKMAPKPSRKRHSPSQDSEGMFHGMSVFLLPQGVQPRRLQVWKKKLLQMGAKIEENLSERVTHIFAVDFSTLKQMIHEKLNIPKISLLKYQWLEDCLKSGERLSENPYVLKSDSKGRAMSGQFLGMVVPNLVEARSHSEGLSPSKRSRVDAQGSKAAEGTGNTEDNMREASYTKDKHTYAGGKIPEDERKLSQCSLGGASHSISPSYDASQEPKELDSLYSPPDLNKDVTEIFGKLVNIYRALGDERRSFSYYKAIIVIEKLPFKIQNAEQVKHLPAIGKSMQDHIKEIVTTGKLSKLEHFEKDEKVQTVTLFGEVWGVGPSTALKLYEKGHRTLDDLKHDDSLTKSQKYGLKFVYNSKKKIPRHEVKEMEMLLQDVGEEILPG
ncbi:hypothetical protein HPP92_016383, partial [Vanilla planifolia]